MEPVRNRYAGRKNSAQAVEDFKAPCPDITSLDERTSPPPEIEPVASGELFATMHVPAWRFMTIPIKEGTSQAVLNTGAAGHYLGTAMPGQVGNFSVAGHRRTYGSNFRRNGFRLPTILSYWRPWRRPTTTNPPCGKSRSGDMDSETAEREIVNTTGWRLVSSIRPPSASMRSFASASPMPLEP